jgi:uncharacterized protein YbcI
MLVLLFENGHTDAETALRATGHAQHVLHGRHLLHEIVEHDLRSSVQRIIGRPVLTTLGATRLDPDLSAEIFLFARSPSEPRVEAEERPMDRARTAVSRSEELKKRTAGGLRAEAPGKAPDRAAPVTADPTTRTTAAIQPALTSAP